MYSNHRISYNTNPEEAISEKLRPDLQFHPAKFSENGPLPVEDIDHYNQQGYLTGIRIFSKCEADNLRAYFDGLLNQVLAEGGNSYSISTAHLTYGRVWDLLNNSKITSYVTSILGPNVIGWGSHFFCKLPGDGKTVSWHQDASYWPISPAKTVTVWLAIDTADTDNACMRFIPRSHLKGHLTYHLSESDENNVLFQTVPNAEKLGRPVNIELDAGEMSLHSDMLLHGSYANNSNRRRCGLTLRYCAADVRAREGWEQKGVIVAGHDEAKHWADPTRPNID